MIRNSQPKIINAVKGASSRKLRNRHPELKEMGDKLWTRTYYVGTAGKVSDTTIRRYIEDFERDENTSKDGKRRSE